MDDIPAHILLREALALLNDRPNFDLRRDPRVTSYRLAGRIEAYFAGRAPVGTPLIVRARRFFGGLPDLRFEPPKTGHIDHWVPAWVRLPAGLVDSGVLATIDAALASLPLMTRDVYLALRDRELEYPAIASEYGITTCEVERHVAAALVRVDEFLTRTERSRSITPGDDDHDRAR